MEYITRTTGIMVLPKGQPIFSEQGTKIIIKDDSAGEFLQILQDNGHIEIELSEWPQIKDAIESMFFQIEKHKTKD